MNDSKDNQSVWTRSGRVWRPWWVFRNPSSRELGGWGEWIALKHLRKQGWDVVARNWKGFHGEVDLIAFDGPWLVFVEVKSTSEGSWCEGFERIDASKRRFLRRACRAYLARLEREPESYRLDAVSVRFSTRSFWPRVRRIYWEKGLFPIDE